jgi:hypothetical protein
LLAGILALVRSVDLDDRGVWPTLLFVISALTYEASLPVSAVALVAVPWIRTGRVRWARAAVQLLALGATTLWMVTHTQHLEQGWFRFQLIYPSHFGWGITPGRALGEVLGLLAAPLIAVAVAAIWLPSLRGRFANEGRLVAVGLAVIALGTLAFARDPIEPIALGDRANVVSSIGAAVAWAGVGLLLWRWRRSAAVVVIVGFAAMSLVGRFWRDLDYARAGKDADHILAAVATRFPTPPAEVVVVGPAPIYHHGVVGLLGEIQEATRAYTYDNRYRALVSNNAAEFDASPPDLRLDVRQVIPGARPTTVGGGAPLGRSTPAAAPTRDSSIGVSTTP